MANWNLEAKQLLKAELVRSGVSYKVLVTRLESFGVVETEGAISNKISRGKFSFAFFLQCMRALGVETVRVAERKS